MKSISLLGSTGSIGANVLSIVRRHPDRFRILSLSAGRNVQLLAEQTREFLPTVVSVATETAAHELRELLGDAAPRIVHGPEGAAEAATVKEANLCFSAIVGAAGLPPTWAAIDAGIDVALANKETLVTAGTLILELARKRGVNLMPVDSEHSAIFQSMVGHNVHEVRCLILTASGGPFRDRDPKTLTEVTVEEALNHPTWKMGRKITIDSATLMNKGLEVIEARWLFDIPPEKIDVVIHPESIIHSMVEFVDGQVVSQMGVPDMCGPIAYALSYPERLEAVMPRMDLAKIGCLNFRPVNRAAFPCLDLAFEALKGPEDAPCVLNGANEVAVQAFLDGRIGFTQIPQIIRRTVETAAGRGLSDLDDVLAADRRARDTAAILLDKAASNGLSTSTETQNEARNV
ncbi:MAG: 1-deoxy-D-xylulose-5-phosphate reductoisomerase [Deltaproteobacteria bacterium]|nr:1-deoxy-D-xylulose-5-phosphate reductoisomerase [Deltaproteobacteria bacterium]